LRFTVLVLFMVLPLGGCGSFLAESTSVGAGIAGAGIASSVTKNATVGAAIGLGVAAGANAALQYAERRVHKTEQDRIATVAGRLRVGAVAAWSVSHSVPIEPNNHGEVTVSRIFGGADFLCKEIIFSVDRYADRRWQREFFIATICRDGRIWRWATAEPATARWGSLQ
jgi:hypothetical protein